MGRSRFKIKEEYYPYFITISVVDGISLFADPEIAKLILESLQFLQTRPKVTLYSYVIMHNHLHAIIEGEELPGHIRKFKSYITRQIIDSMKARNRSLLLKKMATNKHSHHKDSEYQVWQEGYHPKQISSAEIMIQKIEYIHANPLKAGFIEKPEHWRYSATQNYLGLSGIIPVTIFEG